MRWRKLNTVLNQLKKIRKTIRKSLLNIKDVTVISNNCWGGFFYQYFGLQYRSPTVGLYFPPKDYNRFVQRFEYYIDQPLTELKIEDAKNKQLFEYTEKVNSRRVVLGKIDDVECCLLHYHSFEEAREKWERRRKRISRTIVFKNNDNNGFDINCLYDWNTAVKNRKSIFITSKREYADRCTSNIVLYLNTKLKNQDAVDDTSDFDKKFKPYQIINTLVRK